MFKFDQIKITKEEISISFCALPLWRARCCCLFQAYPELRRKIRRKAKENREKTNGLRIKFASHLFGEWGTQSRYPSDCFETFQPITRTTTNTNKKQGIKVVIIAYVTMNNLGDELTHVNFSCVLVIFYYNWGTRLSST